MKRRLLRGAAALLSALVFVELAGHLLWLLKTGRFIWQADEAFGIFNIHALVDPVADERLATMKPDCLALDMGPPRRRWTMRTDARRFRAGANRYSSSEPNVVFIGDSVPFGWGVDASSSVPSLFYQMLARSGRPRLGVINAAVPSYSLNQALARYRLEIAGRFPVRAVVLQTYDPAVQFLVWGRRWNASAAWIRTEVKVRLAGRFVPGLIAAYRYSFLLNAARIADQRRSQLDVRDEPELERFDRVNAGELEGFARLLASEHAALVLLPVNPASPLARMLSNENHDLAVVIERLNGVMRRFAETHRGVVFLDVAAAFDRAGRQGLFIDRCCHLSERGARLQARFLLDELRRRKVL